jgi:hypothetical protein
MDPTIDIAPATPLDPAAFDRAHIRTYAGFAHVLRWFVLHAMVDLVGIAGFVTGHPGFGVTFIVLGTALLIWGVFTTRLAARRGAGQAGSPTHEVAEEAAFLADSHVHSQAA